MKLQNHLPLVATLSIIAMAGCTSLPGSTTTPTPAPSATTYQLSGRITFQNGDPGQALSLGLKVYDGAKWQKETATYSTDASGDYGINGLTPGWYQVFYDDGGQVVQTSAVNTTGMYNSASASVTTTGNATINFDVGWSFSPTIAPNANFQVGTSSFGWAANPNTPDAQYQVLICDDAASTSVWSSPWAATTTASWNGVGNSGSYNGTTVPAGKYYYLIKFQKTGTSFGGDGYYGQTKWVPFNI